MTENPDAVRARKRAGINVTWLARRLRTDRPSLNVRLNKAFDVVRRVAARGPTSFNTLVDVSLEGRKASALDLLSLGEQVETLMAAIDLFQRMAHVARDSAYAYFIHAQTLGYSDRELTRLSKTAQVG